MDTETPPKVYASDPMRKIVLIFAPNPDAMRPFTDWLLSGAAWASFGDWYDGYREHVEGA